MKTQSFVSITLVVLVLSVFISCSEQKKEQQLTVLAWNGLACRAFQSLWTASL